MKHAPSTSGHQGARRAAAGVSDGLREAGCPHGGLSGVGMGGRLYPGRSLAAGRGRPCIDMRNRGAVTRQNDSSMSRSKAIDDRYALAPLRGRALAVRADDMAEQGHRKRLGFVQADPIRAPARAQETSTLRLRVEGYRAGDLEESARYQRGWAIEEDCLVNYGFVPRSMLPLMHPRVAARAWDAETRQRAADVLAFVRARGPTHPRDVQEAFDHGRVASWGSTNSAQWQHGPARCACTTAGPPARRAARGAGTARLQGGQPSSPSTTARGRATTGRARCCCASSTSTRRCRPRQPRLSRESCCATARPHLKGEAARPLLAELRARTCPKHESIDGVTWLMGAGRGSGRGQVARRCRARAAARAVRPDRLGPAPLRAAVGLGLQVRGLHAGREADDEAITRCRCCTATARSAWATLTLVDKTRLETHIGFVDKAWSRDADLAAAVDAELARMAEFLGLDDGASVRLKRARR